MEEGRVASLKEGDFHLSESEGGRWQSHLDVGACEDVVREGGGRREICISRRGRSYLDVGAREDVGRGGRPRDAVVLERGVDRPPNLATWQPLMSW